MPVSSRAMFYYQLAIAVLLVLARASTAEAAPPFASLWTVDKSKGMWLFDWDGPFSLYRWLIFAIAVVGCWLLSFNVLMLHALGLDNPKPPRPKDAFARSAGWFSLFAAVAFVLTFAVLSNDLYHRAWVTSSFPAPLTPLSSHFPWIFALILGVALMFLARYIFRR